MKREPGMAYDTKVLNKIFAVVSACFLLVVIWMVLDDFIRPWKVVQIKALDIEKQKIEEKIKQVEGGINNEELEAIKVKIADAEKEVASRQEEIDQVNEQVNEVQRKIYVQNMYNGVNGSQAAAYQFQYEHALMENHPAQAKNLKVTFDDYKKKEIEGKDKLKGLQAEEHALTNQIRELTLVKTEADKELKNLFADRDLLLGALKSTEKNPIWAMRNSPFIDYLDPTIKIRQYVISNVTDDKYFQQTPKIDRCTTCHVFIDKPGYEDQENPYKSHPKLDTLAVGVDSAHPVKEFGCTSCHGGMGERVNDFNAPAHTPQNQEQAKLWAEKYHWHAPHRIPSPMVALQYTEGQCIKCHKDQERLPMAEKLNEGRQLIEDYGCYACHKIEGWEHLGKPGPALTKVTSKVNSLEWIKNWIWAPHAFNPKSRMPHFFEQENNSDEVSKAKNMAEVNAMGEYIARTSKSYKPTQKFVGGNADKGRELIETIGCVGCHSVDGIDEKFAKIGEKSGPNLVHLGTKVNPDWLVSWLKKPDHYDPTTIMPSFRLTDKEANDIAAFLLNSKNKEFGELKFPALNKELRDEILVSDYFSAFETVTAAKAKLEKMTDDERTLELGRRSINKYGCYSCHHIPGFEGELPPIGPELTKEGSKPVEQFGFGQQKQVPHTRQDWITQHLKTPRIWDVGVPKLFKDLNKMPNFYLSDEEVEKMVTVILGLVDQKIPLAGQKRLNANEKMYQEGMKVANKYNCYGCHKIDEIGGSLSEAFEDNREMGPPFLTSQGHRVDTQWFYDFLKNVHPIRSIVSVRMPTFNFTNEEINKLVMGFQAGSGQLTFAEMAKIEWEPGEREAAKKIWDELACTSCHATGFTKDDPLAPDLHYAKGRLRDTWVEAWLASPQSFMPYVSMPAFWDDGEGGLMSAVDGVLDNDPKRQIRAVRKLIQEFGNGSQPKPFPKNN